MGVKLFFTHLHIRDGAEIGKFRPIPSYCPLKMRIFSINRDLMMDCFRLFFSQKKI